MKRILLTSIAAALCTLPVFGEVEASRSSSSSTVTTDGKGNGKATVTIEVNGKKETREIDLGSGNTKIEISEDGVKPAKTERIVWLGVAPEELPSAVSAQLPGEAAEGILVSAVVPESPAGAAGIQKNDVIVTVDDQAITNPRQLKTLIASHKEGDSVRVGYFRRGQKAEASVKLASRVENDEVIPRILGNKDLNIRLPKLLNDLGASLSIDKEVIVVDKDGNVVSRDKKEVSDKIERELARLREQIEAVQDKAMTAAKRAEDAAKAAADAVKKSLEK